MKILITGANGQLGYHLQQVLAKHELFLGDSHNFDITNQRLVNEQTMQFKPEIVIHAAAYTNVDGAEVNRELCQAVNVDGSRFVAEAANAVGAKIIAISTDYVFAGDQQTPYQETDQANPISFYGQTKYDGEQAVIKANSRHFICRTSWLYGGPKPKSADELKNSSIKNFVYTMLKIGQNHPTVEVVSDQIGAPTYAQDLAKTIEGLMATDRFGIFHLTNSGQTTWADFATTIFKLAKYKTVVKPIQSEQWELAHPTSTKRPRYSVLGHQALNLAGQPIMRSWEVAIADFMSEFKDYS